MWIILEILIAIILVIGFNYSLKILYKREDTQELQT